VSDQEGGPARDVTRLEETPEGGVAVVRGALRYDLPPIYGRTVLDWYRHMQGHGEVMARTYLAGVTHGLGACAEKRVAEAMAKAREIRASGEELLQRARERGEETRT